MDSGKIDLKRVKEKDLRKIIVKLLDLLNKKEFGKNIFGSDEIKRIAREELIKELKRKSAAILSEYTNIIFMKEHQETLKENKEIKILKKLRSKMNKAKKGKK